MGKSLSNKVCFCYSALQISTARLFLMLPAGTNNSVVDSATLAAENYDTGVAYGQHHLNGICLMTDMFERLTFANLSW